MAGKLVKATVAGQCGSKTKPNCKLVECKAGREPDAGSILRRFQRPFGSNFTSMEVATGAVFTYRVRAVQRGWNYPSD